MKIIARVLITGLVVAGASIGTGPASRAADAAGDITRTVLMRQDLDVPGREVVMVRVEIPPGVSETLHTHPAELFAYVVEGEMAIEVQGEPTRMLRPGDTFHVPTGKVHRGINRGKSTVKISTVFVAQKGQPLSVPAP